MQNLPWKILLILVVLVGCGLAIVPPEQKIRLGRDLSGGVSLIYAVRMDEDADRQAVLAQTIEVLKERVNPDGVLDIQMTPLGTDRIEVVMPLPNDEVKQLAAVWRGHLEDLLDEAQVRPGTLDRVLGEGTAVEELGGSTTARGTLIVDLQAAWTRYIAAEASLKETPGDATLEQAAADLEIEVEDLREQVLAMSLERGAVTRLLQLDAVGEVLRDSQGLIERDPATGEPLRGPAPRAAALAELQSSYPLLGERLRSLVTAFDEYQMRRTGFDDPEDLVRMLKGAGVLDFRVAVEPGKSEGIDVEDLRRQLAEVGPENTDSTVARWYAVNSLEQWYEKPDQLASLLANPRAYFAGSRLEAAEYDSDIYLLLYDDDTRSMTHRAGKKWSVTAAYQSADQFGRPAVAFNLDPSGGSLMGRLTGPHVGRLMAIVLDDQVYSAPNLNSQINNSGQVMGSFSQEEISYLLRVLAAGSLEARLSPEPIAVNIIGPTIGQDNLGRGLRAFGWSVLAVAVFMLLYYFFAGLVADFALLGNGLIIFGVMALIDGTFTLPGLAGVVLTMGMAVDANVLIYERIREEMAAGARDLREAVREGYRKVFSTIIDANVTNLIVCFVLYRTATTEVKGFAVTLSIGIIATLFTALFVTRVIFAIYAEVLHRRSLPMLPIVVPAIGRALHPNINWVGLRKAFWTFSLLACLLSGWLMYSRGVQMFDTEFRGGVTVTMRTRLLEGDSRLLLSHTGEGSVEQRVHAIGEAVSGDTVKDQVLAELGTATVLTLGEPTLDEQGVLVADGFQIKVANPPGLDDEQVATKVIVEAITEAFGDDLDVPPSLTFRGSGSSEFEKFTHQVPAQASNIEDVIGRGRGDLANYRGGVLVVVEEIEPAITLAEATARIDRMRQQPEYARDAAGRDVEVFGLHRGSGESYDSIAIAIYDPDMNYLRNNPEVVDERLAAGEWSLIATALAQPESLEQVSSYSSQIARTMKANAIVAVILSLLGILAYIWLRFGSLRYSLAAILALVHDVILTLGALALAGFVASSVFFGDTLMIEAFQIDLGVIAALLTVIGYSLNDTIVILDRIRENRGKRPLPTMEIVNNSINQTVSRTVLTSVTTLIAVVIIYAAGGSGIRPFAFCLIVGIIVGTYSSVAIAAPLVFKGHSKPEGSSEPAIGDGIEEVPLPGVAS